jgi:hypothetical protein
MVFARPRPRWGRAFTAPAGRSASIDHPAGTGHLSFCPVQMPDPPRSRSTSIGSEPNIQIDIHRSERFPTEVHRFPNDPDRPLSIPIKIHRSRSTSIALRQSVDLHQPSISISYSIQIERGRWGSVRSAF